MLKKFIIFFLSLLLLPASISEPVYAQSPVTSSTISLPATVSPTSPIYTDLIVNNMFHSFSCLIAGTSVIGQPCLSYEVQKNAEGVIQSVPVLSSTNLSGGALGATTSLIAALYINPPVRTGDYLGSLGEQIGIVKPAHAQVVGSGNQILQPILKLWQVSRNISYLIMIIVFVIIGLMVMFRNRINPQTVITAQAALPGLIIGLLLITFSYFLAALIADTAFIGTNLIGYYFGAARGDTSQNLLNDLTDYHGSVLSIFSHFTGIITKDSLTEVVGSIWESFSEDTRSFLTLLATFVAAQLTAQGTETFKAIPVAGEPIQALIVGSASFFSNANPTAATGVLLFVIAMAILLYSMFKLLLRLINNFLAIIFLTVTAPFQFLAAALPGRQGIATGWILNVLANVLAFPAVLAVFYFIAFILGPSFRPLQVPPLNNIFRVSDSGINTAESFVPTVTAQTPSTAQSNIENLNRATFPLLGGMNLDFIKLLLAFGALIVTPTIPDIISRTIGRATQAGQLLGQEISGTSREGRGYAGQFQQGVGSASQYGARARGLFDTPGWDYTDEKGVFQSQERGSGFSAGGIKRAQFGWGKVKGFFGSKGTP